MGLERAKRLEETRMLALAKAMVSIVLGGLTWSLAEYGLHNWLGHHGGAKITFRGSTFATMRDRITLRPSGKKCWRRLL